MGFYPFNFQSYSVFIFAHGEISMMFFFAKVVPPFKKISFKNIQKTIQLFNQVINYLYMKNILN